MPLMSVVKCWRGRGDWQMFRAGADSVDIARPTGLTETRVVSILHAIHNHRRQHRKATA